MTSKKWDDLTAREKRDPMRMKSCVSDREDPPKAPRALVVPSPPKPKKRRRRRLGFPFFKAARHFASIPFAIGGLGLRRTSTIRSLLVSTPALRISGPAQSAEPAGGASPENQESKS